ncbi:MULTISPECIES: ArsB/NhaD family transporter [unclassified Leptolyngbya]|uniref:ArsB/NhaD family transporter n=1 Tax=unclassified Leptolyngbya TaxID=2650499 RepID=UPI0016869992|nr:MULTISPECIES: ArsB/NhaD family transporter [unclassified Leptolyngbya]MBD1910048.1 ArsB/NhaD family transporter [Leptolyngbya sp. FACHB-8]MBD2153065.1 ArsB/NhaD family transporter [Leptolyngbya sp. FACHB-16]
MDSWQAIASLVIFVGVLVVIIGEWVHLTIAAYLGAMLLIGLNILTLPEAISYIGRSHATLGLFFGVMVMVRAFEPTKVFEYLATQMIILAKGQGKRLLLGIVAITTPICAVLPNATTVMLLAPLIPPMAEELNVNFVPLLILMVFVANSAGLLTLVGDPATFIVGDAINIRFLDYLMKLSLGGVIAVLTITLILPWLFPKIWNRQLDDLEHLPRPQINHPRTLVIGSLIVAFVLIFFVIGEALPIPVSPATVALTGAGLCLLLTQHTKIDSVQNILRDVDWSTLIFFMSTFVMIGALEKTGVISNASRVLAFILGQNIALGAIVLMVLIGLISSLIPNIPLVVAMVPLLKEYVVNVGLAPAEVLSPDFTGQFPPEVLPLFYAMMYGATLGGNGTLVGASSNIVAAGISEQHGRRISFRGFLRYGLPVTVLQLFTVGIYLVVRFIVFKG